MSLQGHCFSLSVLIKLLWKGELDPCEPMALRVGEIYY